MRVEIQLEFPAWAAEEEVEAEAEAEEAAAAAPVPSGAEVVAAAVPRT
jgi:hypothetical protein